MDVEEEQDRERERETDRQTDRYRGVCVCMCVCVYVGGRWVGRGKLRGRPQISTQLVPCVCVCLGREGVYRQSREGQKV